MIDIFPNPFNTFQYDKNITKKLVESDWNETEFNLIEIDVCQNHGDVGHRGKLTD